ncbi:signal transduction histidine kinase/tetratricopeptide (TPR) repeat protein [Algoriphagus iocasae]|uniref:histidine kinase n=1 Tax=Algoriphagus iocasae TaxID=1836499 RepID=A0A841MKZ3_9BACT|nr:sensor histidine kinase [Algoriphagus iocasae]MBB6326069.1 signal transduction histidine kinase/tetratricopeptide (TPR) repeat protein [Algoriphagus iocasae]
MRIIRVFSLFFLVLTFSTNSFSQSIFEVLDSLKVELQQSKTPTEEAAILSELTWFYVQVSLDTAVMYGKKAIEVANDLNDPVLLSQAYSDLAYAWMEKGELVNARENYQSALDIRYEIGDSSKIYGTITNLGSVYQRDFQSDSAMANYLKALAFFERSGNERNADFIRNNIGVIYLELKNYRKALEILEQVAKYREANEDYYNLATTLNNLGSIHKHQGDDKKSEETYLKALEIYKDIGDAYYTSTTYNNLATLYNSQKRSKLAIEFAEEGLKLAEQAGATYDYVLLLSNLAQSYSDLKEFPKSKQYYLESVAGFKAQNAEEDLMTMYLLMSPVYAALNMPDSSAHYTQEYIALQRKLSEQEILELTSDLETKYQSEKKDKEIAENQLALRTKNIQLFGSLGLAVILAIVGYLLYNQQKLKNRQLQQEVELKAALAQIETQNKLQEQRVLISRDLHDNIGAQLTFIISAIENLKYFDPIKETLSHRYESIADFAKQTITELRDTIWAMNAGQITWEQLASRISNYLQNAEKASSIKFDFQVSENLTSEHQLASADGIQVYRILQEGIQNAVKYADPNTISVKVYEQELSLHLEINDDGKGFDESKILPGNGLFNMRKRAEELGGTISIISEKGKGTQIHLIWPTNS